MNRSRGYVAGILFTGCGRRVAEDVTSKQGVQEVLGVQTRRPKEAEELTAGVL